MKKLPSPPPRFSLFLLCFRLDEESIKLDKKPFLNLSRLPTHWSPFFPLDRTNSPLHVGVHVWKVVLHDVVGGPVGYGPEAEGGLGGVGVGQAAVLNAGQVGELLSGWRGKHRRNTLPEFQEPNLFARTAEQTICL